MRNRNQHVTNVETMASLRLLVLFGWVRAGVDRSEWEGFTVDRENALTIKVLKEKVVCKKNGK